MLYLGVDLGGTNIKAAVVDESCEILAHTERPTGAKGPADEVLGNIFLAMQDAVGQAGISLEQIKGLGLCCPGIIDSEAGTVRNAHNLGWENTPVQVREYLYRRSGLHAVMGNDANVAALAEAFAGCAKDGHNAIIVPLGTGVGCGVILDGKLYTGSGPASELGHMVIVKDGEQCTCGRKGCLEMYASVTGLVRITREAMEKYPDSAMHRIAREKGKVSGRTAFLAAAEGDRAGSEVVDKYIGYVACGITNIANIFFPDVIAISGAICKEGETLLAPLREKVYAELFGGRTERSPRIEVCALGHNTGVIGAAMLSRQETCND